MKKWFKNLLGITQLELEVSALKQENKAFKASVTKTFAKVRDSYALKTSLDQVYDKICDRVDKTSEFSSAINYKLERLQENFNIGLDIASPTGRQYGDRSWAVICINTQTPMLQFINLNDVDAKTIKYLLEPFNTHNRTIDAPPGSFFLKSDDVDWIETNNKDKKGRRNF